jgi:hypothetical protein
MRPSFPAFRKSDQWIFSPSSAILMLATMLILLVTPACTFLPQTTHRSHHRNFLQVFRLSSDIESAPLQSDTLDEVKADLVRCCTRPSKPLLAEVQNLVRELEDVAEQVHAY